MTTSTSEPATVDFQPPEPPKQNIDHLVEYLTDVYPDRKRAWMEMAKQARSLTVRSDMVNLAYECILFRAELDPWLALAGQIHDEIKGNQVDVTLKERANDKKRPTTEMMNATVGVHVAPIKRAVKELTDMQDLLSKTLSWCQSQQKSMAREEYGEVFQQDETAPEHLFQEPPSVADDIPRM